MYANSAENRDPDKKNVVVTNGPTNFIALYWHITDKKYKIAEIIT